MTMLRALLIATLTMASAGAMAQTDTAPTTIQFRLQKADMGCPVNVFAQRRAAGEVSWAGVATPREHGQGLNLRFNRLAGPKIEMVKLTVYGLAGEGRTMYTNAPASQMVTESFALARPSAAESLLESKIWTSKMTVVQRVELNSITYTDGSMWVASQGSKCGAVPDNFQLVANR
jgi:hypothetical protein